MDSRLRGNDTERTLMNILNKIVKFLFFLLVIATLGGVVYYNRDNYKRAYQNIRLSIGWDKPCTIPITYYIGDFDEKFGQTRSQFITNMNKAVSIWNSALGRELFKYSDDKTNDIDDLKINLIFDNRQEATVQMNTIGSTIDNSKSSYSDLKAKYTSLQNSYNSQKSAIQILINTYEANKTAYEKAVAYWNSRGGATKEEFSKLQKTKASLNLEATNINDANKRLNDTINQLNYTANSLNSLNKEINQNVSTYNTISTSNGPEFQEGEYVSDETGQIINIYQYKDYNKLIRVLAHEFGHALGLDHVADSKAIMYAYNMDSNLTLTTDDITALKNVCEIK